MLARKALAGTAGAPKVYVEDVFSTYLWDGNATARNIVNGIDLSGEGGMVWTKYRNTTNSHRLYDTARGATKEIFSDLTNAESTASQSLTAFNADGFSLGTGQPNENTATVVGWTFRKAEKFFDVVTYTGNGASGARAISHNLGSTPGCYIVKRTDSTNDWPVYHRMINGGTNPHNYWMSLNTTTAQVSNTGYFGAAPTSTNFYVADNINTNGGTYVAYLFAHDAGGFGDAGSDNVISCGSFTTNGSGVASVSLGYEPQWVLVKRTDSTSDWFMIDNMRGWTAEPNNPVAMLRANLSSAENTASFTGWSINATGFGWSAGAASATYIYIAIRRGPMKTPTVGTDVFYPKVHAGTSSYSVGFPTDLCLAADQSGNALNTVAVYRLAGNNAYLGGTASTAAEVSVSVCQFNLQNSFQLSYNSNNQARWHFRRAPGFFDVVCYTGTGSATTVSHNLGVAPELMIVKRRETANAWAVYANNDNTDYLVLNTTAATVDDNTYWNDTSPTSSVFSVGTNNATNASGSTYVAYLFASLSGVSKIGTYTGNGSSVTVTTNFQPRFILVKRTDSTGDWIVSDSARGLVAGDDPFLKLNSTAAEVTNEDWVDITSTSFTVNQTTNNANVNTGTYIYLAIA